MLRKVVRVAMALASIQAGSCQPAVQAPYSSNYKLVSLGTTAGPGALADEVGNLYGATVETSGGACCKYAPKVVEVSVTTPGFGGR
jgi:hypothetical protein